MAGPDKTTPPAASPEPEGNAGYAEPNPRDREDARQPHPRKRENPDRGGLDREPETHPGAADD